MHDIEKVIKGLEETEIMLSKAVDRGGEMSVMGAFKCLKRVTDTLALLKEQEPVMWSYDGYNCFMCSNCGLRVNDEVYYIMDKPISFCPACGRKVKWYDRRAETE